MRGLARNSFTFALLGVAILAHAAGAQATSPPVPRCYRLARGEWSRPLGVNARYHALPSVFRLDTVPARHGWKVEPDIAFPTRNRFSKEWPHWTRQADTLVIVWSDGFQATTLRLLPTKGVALRGTASIWSDGNEFGRYPPRASAVARPVSCAELRAALVDSIGRALRRNYVWPDTAVRMADHLSHQLRAGAYDSIADPSALAAALTHDLRTVYRDVHLSVSWEPSRHPSGGDVRVRPSRGARQGAGAAEERHHKFGFRDARILPGNIGYVAIDRLFDVSRESQAALDSVMRIVRHGSALVLDLRDNHGGSPDMVRAICNYLFAAPTHLNDLFERRSGATTAYWTKPDRRVRTLFAVPVYVLVSHETFSAAEELAYDLQSRHRAVIVGETTGGGAHAVWGIPVGQGFVANVPYARAINPVTKTNWEGVGVRPDVKVRADSALEAAVRRYREKGRR